MRNSKKESKQARQATPPEFKPRRDSGGVTSHNHALRIIGVCGALHTAEFERELTAERIRSGIAVAKARGKKLGRQPGQRPKSDRLAPKVLALVAQGRSYRLVGREIGLSKNTVAGIIKRARAAPAGR